VKYIAVPGKARVDEKEEAEIDKYQDLTMELRSLWKVKTNVIPIVLGTLRTVPKGLEKSTNNDKC